MSAGEMCVIFLQPILLLNKPHASPNGVRPVVSHRVSPPLAPMRQQAKKKDIPYGTPSLLRQSTDVRAAQRLARTLFPPCSMNLEGTKPVPNLFYCIDSIRTVNNLRAGICTVLLETESSFCYPFYKLDKSQQSL